MGGTCAKNTSLITNSIVYLYPNKGSAEAGTMMFFGTLIGIILQVTHGNYLPVFLMAGFAYLLAIGVIQLLVLRISTADVS